MKKIIQAVLSLAVAIAIILDVFFLFVKDRINAKTTTSSTSTAVSTTSASSVKKTYQNGTYTGKTVTTPRGKVQVQAVISAGKITQINVLKYPNSNGKDQQINSRVIPIYKSEALKSQSANIKLVSGASETYKGFTGSLQNALNQSEDQTNGKNN
ncbi:FMN-binding protein [Paucilactobacillus suebicus]|uniref:FMN-binding domain-containing protein n=1 Tax=Paucilactobacillus suebicus DSM 5007 = KCTC 3549 TaxID=1423807 RepID=A0A0R1W497_9LACO|nr:FMN-binding protein [Paucilactobacillus suebicus]KRM12319.1 hypothetical protein FD16_GL002504 [Paucilactobacillus suebicus DSM 5007 = KCTC 3549]